MNRIHSIPTQKRECSQEMDRSPNIIEEGNKKGDKILLYPKTEITSHCYFIAILITYGRCLLNLRVLNIVLWNIKVHNDIQFFVY